MNIAVCDTETTGLDPETASIVELAVVTLPSLRANHTFVKPEHPIELQAMAIHHITEEMVVDAPDLKTANKITYLDLADVIVAHNAAFDSGFLRIDKPWVCTYRCARHLWKDAPKYSNQVLRYWLPGMREEIMENGGAEIMKLPPHRALPDAWVTAHILKRMLLEHSIEDLVALTKKPIMIESFNFGKHNGKTVAEVVATDPRYLRWMLQQDFDSDTVYTIKHHLGIK